MAAVGQAPAQQRLDDARLAGREVHLRLEVELELAAVDGAAQALLGGKLGGRRLQQLRAEYAHTAAALRLGVEQRRVGRAQEPFRVAAVDREQARTEAEAHQELAPVDDERLLEALHQPVRGALDVCGRLHPLDDDGELVAAEARAEADLPHHRAQALGNRLQHAVAEHVAHAVVDVLEVVEVEEEHAGKRIALRRARQRLVELHQELAPVRQPRQRVVGGEVLQLARALLDLGLELAVVLAGQLLGRRQPLGHLVEGNRQRVEFLDAAARHDDARLAAGETLGRPHQAPHRQDDAAHRADDRREQQQQHDGAQPGEHGCAAGAPAR